jgi:predicted transcriptional regulator
MSDSLPEPRFLNLTAETVAAYLEHNPMSADAPPGLIQEICSMGAKSSGRQNSSRSEPRDN